MSGKFREYNWRDIERLIYADMGLTTEEAARTKGSIRYRQIDPTKPLETCMAAYAYDLDYDERLNEHSS